MPSASIQVFTGIGQPFSAREVKLPRQLNPGEILVKILLASICGSDLHTVDGRREAPTPCILGHEGVGQVLESNRPGVPVGQRVTWTLADSCGCCTACQSWQLPQKCEQLFKYGHAALHDGHGLNGCYASHLVLRPGTAVVPIPESLSDRLVVPANCALATIINALEQLPDPCERVLIQGAGLLGIYAAAVLKTRGIPQVYCVDLSTERMAAIAPFGAIAVAPGKEMLPFDLVLEVAGSSQVIPDGIKSLRFGGSYVWAGMVHPQTPLSISGESIVKKCLQVRGVHNYAPNHLQASLNFLEEHQGQFPFDDLISPAMKLSQLNEAFALTRTRRWLRVCVKP